MRIWDTGNQGGRDQRANARDRFKAPAQLIRPVPGKDAPVSLEDLPLHQHELSLQCPQAFLCGGRETLIHPSISRSSLSTPLRPIPAMMPNSAR